MEAQPIPGTLFAPINDSLGNTSWQLQVARDSPTAFETAGDSLESQIFIELSRRYFLRQVQRNIVSCMNAYSVVLVLLASVTFMGFLQPPGGLDGDGNLKQMDNPYMKTFITFVSSSFHLAVTGILVCMSCLTLVIPDDSTYVGGMLVGEMNSSLALRSVNLTDQQMLHSTLVKTNNRASLAVRVARLLVIVTKLYFVTSLSSGVMVFESSMFVVIRGGLPSQGHPDRVLRNQFSIFSYTFSGIFLLYSLSLLWNIISSVTNTLPDIMNLISTSDIVNTISTCFKNAINVIKDMNMAWVFNYFLNPSSWVNWFREEPKLWTRWIQEGPKLWIRWVVVIFLFLFIIHYFNYICCIFFLFREFNHSLDFSPAEENGN